MRNSGLCGCFVFLLASGRCFSCSWGPGKPYMGLGCRLWGSRLRFGGLGMSALGLGFGF